MSYAPSIKLHTQSAIPIERAVGGCKYLVRDYDNFKWRECGDPATHKLNVDGGTKYCDRHARMIPKQFDVRPLREEEKR